MCASSGKAREGFLAQRGWGRVFAHLLIWSAGGSALEAGNVPGCMDDSPETGNFGAPGNLLGIWGSGDQGCSLWTLLIVFALWEVVKIGECRHAVFVGDYMAGEHGCATCCAHPPEDILCWVCWVASTWPVAEDRVSQSCQAAVSQPSGPPGALLQLLVATMTVLSFDVTNLGHCFVKFSPLSLGCRLYLFPSTFFIQAINHLLAQIQGQDPQLPLDQGWHLEAPIPLKHVLSQFSAFACGFDLLFTFSGL